MSLRPSLQTRIEQEHQEQRIDLSPLLDVVFILLIFFIVTTVFVKESGVEVNKPQALSTSQLPQALVMIAITANGQVVHDGKQIGVNGVRSTVRQLQNERHRPVVIQADKQVSADLLVQVIDEAKLGGAPDVSIATEL